MFVSALDLTLSSDGAWKRAEHSSGEGYSARARASKGELFVFIDSAIAAASGVASARNRTGEGLEEIRQSLVEEIAEEFYNGPGRTITSSLSGAIQTLNERLLEVGLESLGLSAGIAVGLLALRESDAYIALSGPAVLYIVGSTGVKMVGEVDPTVPASGPGLYEEPDVELLRYRLEDDTGLLLLGQELVQHAPARSIRQVMVNADNLDAAAAIEAVARASLSGANSRQLFSALLVSVTDLTRPDLISLSPTSGVEDEQESKSDPDEAEEPPDEPSATFPSLSVPPPRLERPRPPIGDRTIDAFDGVLAFFGSTAKAWRRSPPRFLIAFLLLFILALVLAFPVRLYFSGQSGFGDFNLVGRAESKERDAQAQTDSSTKISLLVEAAALADRAAEIRPADPTASAAKARIDSLLDALTNTVRLPDSPPLVTLEGEPVELTLGNSGLYVLDRSLGRVFRYATSPDGKTLLPSAASLAYRRADRIGESTTADPARLIWMPGGLSRTYDALLVIDSEGRLYESEPSRGVHALALPFVYRQDILITGYAGSLFALDPTLGKLTWHTASPTGFDRSTNSYFSADAQPNLGDVKSIAVEDDLYLLRRTGQIERYSLGRRIAFDGKLPDLPIAENARLIARRDGLFVFDRENARLIQFDRAGALVRQFRFPSRDEVRDVAVDSTRGQIYYLTKAGVSVGPLR